MCKKGTNNLGKMCKSNTKKCGKMCKSIYLFDKLSVFKRCQILMAPFLNEMKASTALIKHHADQNIGLNNFLQVQSLLM